MLRQRWFFPGLLILGLALRLWHYLRDPVIWHDEAALIRNAVDKSFADHLGPLFYAEAAPPLFLSIEKSVALLLGDSTFALRLIPFLASCLAFVGLLLIARTLLQPLALNCFALLWACSDRLLWHCCEAKPYAVDVFVAALVMGAFLWFRTREKRHYQEGRPGNSSECWLYACLSPWLIFVSFPACFVLGGLAIALLPTMLRNRRAALFVPYALFLLLMSGAFLVLVLGPIQAQRQEHLLQDWTNFFPDWNHPALVPAKLLLRLTEAARYACEPVGQALFPLAILGGVLLWRQGQRELLILLAAPLLLTCLACLLHRYPVGPSRVMAFAAPAFLLLMARGCEATLLWLQTRHRLAPLLLLAILLTPAGIAGYRMADPWERTDTRTAVALVEQQRQPGDMVIGTAWEHAWYFRRLGAMYRPLLSEPHAPPFPPALDGNTGIVGQRCWVLVRDTWREKEKAALAPFLSPQQWTVRQRHRLDHITVYHLERNDERLASVNK